MQISRPPAILREYVPSRDPYLNNLLDLNAKKLKIALTQDSCLVMHFSTPLRDLHPWDWGNVYLHQKGLMTFLIEDNHNWDFIHALHNKITKLLNGNLELDAKIEKDIGLYWNDYFREPTNESFRKNQHGKICGKYRVFSLPAGTDKLFNTWLYSKNGKIFFEVTPFYPWSMRPRKRHERWYTYKTFIKLYEPVAVIELSQERVREIVAILNGLIAIMNKNSENVEYVSARDLIKAFLETAETVLTFQGTQPGSKNKNKME